ncbi:clathrin light chain [Pseudovirgaria hyperparasitica]|uniref:Clathrin light chain n=1 Tax=Pseudovirgaria hyperparasitica TaxID=470096 RepID=A0A6A6WBI3_9PEZI|nr:clathrin light chain [Pseudovirgaria hyperparasitica]KAF2759196.1 clathrin light chain [Pseudovirgaria hyperparasitica]
MADRFPSLDEIDAGQTEARGQAGFDLVGDSADGDDFLSRERAALGDDANQFASPNDNLAATVEDGDDDLLGGGSSYQPPGNAEEMSFNNDFPAIDTSNEHMAPGGTITGTSMPFLPGAPQTTASSYIPQSNEPEPEVIREWREKRDLQVQHRDEVSANRKAEAIKAAHEQIDDFYENYNNKKEKQTAQTRREAEDFIKSREDTTAGGTSWERIAKLVDLSGKGTRGGGSGTEKQRFRELLLSLRKDEKAPGASGV